MNLSINCEGKTNIYNNLPHETVVSFAVQYLCKTMLKAYVYRVSGYTCLVGGLGSIPQLISLAFLPLH